MFWASFIGFFFNIGHFVGKVKKYSNIFDIRMTKWTNEVNSNIQKHLIRWLHYCGPISPRSSWQRSIKHLLPKGPLNLKAPQVEQDDVVAALRHHLSPLLGVGGQGSGFSQTRFILQEVLFCSYSDLKECFNLIAIIWLISTLQASGGKLWRQELCPYVRPGGQGRLLAARRAQARCCKIYSYT